MNWIEVLLLMEWEQALRKANLPPKSLKPRQEKMLTFIKETQKGTLIMSGKLIHINDQDVKVDSFEATDHGENIHFSITRTADNGASTGALVSLFGKALPVNIVDSDSKVTFTLNDAQISEYKYFTREDQSALEYFKIEGNKIGVK